MDFIQLVTQNIRTHGLQLPSAVPRSGIYVLTFESGAIYFGQTGDIIVRVGGHRRTYDDIAAISFCPLPADELAPAFRSFEQQHTLTSRTHDAGRTTDAPPIEAGESADPYLERIRWIEENVPESGSARDVESPGQRERTRPHFDRLTTHPEFGTLQNLVSLYLERVIPAPEATERRNWVITSMPSTARTRVWRRLLCLSVNNVEALTIGEQFDGQRWSVAGFMSAGETGRSEKDVLSIACRRRGAFIAPTYYKTVGNVSQIGFDNLDALRLLLDSDPVVDLVGELVMRLMKRGRGMYGRFHDYNLADAVLHREPPEIEPSIE